MKRQLMKMSAKGHEVLREWDTDTATPEEIKAVEEEFNQRMKEGFFAADITDKRDVLVKEFNPNADLLLIPKIQGG